MIILTGLGNPGFKYRHTRHNAGFEAIDVIAKHYNVRIDKKGRKSLYGEAKIAGEKVILVKPQTYMNASGESVCEWVRFYQVDPAKELIVISDDVALAPGNMRIRKKGSAGGHNGLKSIIRDIGTEEFLRIRLGVGSPEPGDDMIGHVLRKPRREDRQKLIEVYGRCIGAAELLIRGNVDQAMNEYNAKKG
ncbi:MAG: aminoacyl-tRNA hydrolase [Lachnospiraceae bacterium]|nr:aminoacyl-tRNA hydrolase [Lachnospiraceae bacterium]